MTTPDPQAPSFPAAHLASAVAEAALKANAQDVVVLDVRELVDYAQVVVVCSAPHPQLISTIAMGVKQAIKGNYRQLPSRVEGLLGDKWGLIDYDQVIVHVFYQPYREFYDLDGLWQGAPRLPTPLVANASEPTPVFSLNEGL